MKPPIGSMKTAVARGDLTLKADTHGKDETARLGEAMREMVDHLTAIVGDIRERGLKIKPTCPYVRNWLTKHPEYEDLVVSSPAGP